MSRILSVELMKRGIGFRCPNCKGLLVETKNSFLCDECHVDWKIREGIASFFEDDVYWSDKIPETEAVTLTKIAAEEGWKTALHDVFRWNHRNDYRITSDLRRADFRFLMPLNNESTVLVLGCGLGAITVALSKVCRVVVALSDIFEYVKFLDIRRQQERILNIFPVHGGNTLHLPFPEDCFDAVVAVGMSQWAGVAHRNVKLREAENNLLLSVYKALKVGGHLYVGVANKHGCDHLMGRHDHNGGRFASLRPGKLVDTVSWIISGTSCRTHQYSPDVHTRILQGTGFREIRFYAPLPEHHEPHFFIPLDNVNVMKYFLNNSLDSFEFGSPQMREKYRILYRIGKVAAKIALSLGLAGSVKYVVPSYGIIARK